MPGGCVELAQNGGFEAGFAGWVPGASALRPAVVAAPVYSGDYAAQMGSQVDNINSFSSIRQPVTVPWGYARTFLSFWAYTWAEVTGPGGGSDRQQFVLLGPGNVVWAVPWKVLENEQAWQQHMYELVGVGGQTFDLYFGTINDGVGGRTALYLDDVRLWGCGGDPWPATTTSDAAAEADRMVIAQGAPPLDTVPVPQVYPVETLPALLEPMQTAVPSELPAGAAPQADALPLPEWTVVAIGTSAVTGLVTRAAPGEKLPAAASGEDTARAAAPVAQLRSWAPKCLRRRSSPFRRRRSRPVF